MRYRLLGKSGLRVSELCLGAMGFGAEWGWGAAREESEAIFNAYLEAGGNFIDTANVYQNGVSENWVGDFTAGKRDKIVIATKYSMVGSAAPDVNTAGNHRKHMMHSVESSLKRLKTDYIDLYWSHNWDQITPAEEIMRGMDDLVRQGKILHCGISDAPAWWLARANTIAELRNWTPFVALQIPYNLIERSVERELIPAAKHLGLTITTWGPLSSGILTGKYLKPGTGRRFDSEWGKAMAPKGDRVDAIVAVVGEVADALGCTRSQVALAWNRQQSRSVIPILGVRNKDQLLESLPFLELKIPDELMQKLNDVSALKPEFPDTFLNNPLSRPMVYGAHYDLIDP